MAMIRTSKALLVLAASGLLACSSSAQQPITKLVEPTDVKTGWALKMA